MIIKNDLAVIENFANELLDKYNLKGWKFRWSNATRRFGSCSKYRKTISVSKLHGLYDDIELVLDTILHEIAHGLTPKNQPSHGNVWKRNALIVGCEPKSCKKSSIPQEISCKWIGTCINCSKEVFFNKRSKLFCRSCYDRYAPNGERIDMKGFKFKYRENPKFIGYQEF